MCNKKIFKKKHLLGKSLDRMNDNEISIGENHSGETKLLIPFSEKAMELNF